MFGLALFLVLIKILNRRNTIIRFSAVFFKNKYKFLFFYLNIDDNFQKALNLSKQLFTFKFRFFVKYTGL